MTSDWLMRVRAIDIEQFLPNDIISVAFWQHVTFTFLLNSSLPFAFAVLVRCVVVFILFSARFFYCCRRKFLKTCLYTLHCLYRRRWCFFVGGQETRFRFCMEKNTHSHIYVLSTSAGWDCILRDVIVCSWPGKPSIAIIWKEACKVLFGFGRQCQCCCWRNARYYYGL